MATQNFVVGTNGPNDEIKISLDYDDVTLKTSRVRVVNATPTAVMPAHNVTVRVVDGVRSGEWTFGPGTNLTRNLPNNIFMARAGAEDDFAVYVPYEVTITVVKL